MRSEARGQVLLLVERTSIDRGEESLQNFHSCLDIRTRLNNGEFAIIVVHSPAVKYPEASSIEWRSPGSLPAALTVPWRPVDNSLDQVTIE